MARSPSRESLLPPLWVIVLGTLFGLVWVLYQLKELVVLLVIGFSCAYVIDPMLNRLERKGWSRSAGVIFVLAVMLLCIIGLALTALPTIVREFYDLTFNFPHYLSEAKVRLLTILDSVRERFPEGMVTEDMIVSPLNLLQEYGGKIVPLIGTTLYDALLSGYSKALAIVNIALLPFIVYYLAVEMPNLRPWVMSFFPALKRQKADDVLEEIDTLTSAYVRGQLLVGFVLFLLYAVGLGIVGVELWFLLAVVSGFGNLVPYLGFIIGIMLSSVMALVTFGDFWHLLQVWIVYAVVQFLEGTFITPKIVGDSTGLSPLVVILAIVAGGSLFGLLGVFLAVPVAAAIRVLARHFHTWIISKA